MASLKILVTLTGDPLEISKVCLELPDLINASKVDADIVASDWYDGRPIADEPKPEPAPAKRSAKKLGVTSAITLLGLSSRIVKILEERRIRHIQDLIAFSDRNLLRITGIGPVAIFEIRNCLKSAGYELQHEPTKIKRGQQLRHVPPPAGKIEDSESAQPTFN